MRIIMDTNFLVYCAQNRIDFVSELERICDFPYKLFIIDKTIDELNRLKGKVLIPARIAKEFISTFKIEKIESQKTVDDALIDNCDENTIIATNDEELIKMLDCRVIIVRQKKFLCFKRP